MTYSGEQVPATPANAVRRAMRSAEEAGILRLCALLAGAMPGVQDRARGGPDTAGADMTKAIEALEEWFKDRPQSIKDTARSSPPLESLSGSQKRGSTGPFALTSKATGQYRWNLTGMTL